MGAIFVVEQGKRKNEGLKREGRLRWGDRRRLERRRSEGKAARTTTGAC